MYLNIISVDAYYLFILSKAEWFNKNSPLVDEKNSLFALVTLCVCQCVETFYLFSNIVWIIIT